MPTVVSISAPSPSLGKAVSGVTPVPVRAAAKAKQPAKFTPSHTSWPAAGSGTVSLTVAAGASSASGASSTSTTGAAAKASTSAASGTARSAGRVTVAGTPVWMSLPAGKPVSQGPSSVAVAVAPHQAAVNAGVDGVIFSAKASTGSGSVQVGLDYASFAQVYGGNFGQRLTLVQLPACALTTPQLAACRKQTRLASVNNAAAQSVSAQVSLGASGAPKASGASSAATSSVAGANTAMVLAATSSPSGGDGGGSAGQYGATSLKPSGTWSAGGTDGSFTYAYPITVPPAASALAPQVSLSYNSGSVDGQTSASQAQSDWLGDGWSTPENFIEQSFVSCSDSPEGTASPQATQDECYDGPILTISLNGSSTQLVCNQAETSCTPSDDNGDVVVHHTGANNASGTYNTDYWTITDRSGTTYSFGLNELPGWTSGQPKTNSVSSEPVFSAHSGDPCYNATWSQSVCTMAYRWNLDYAKDLYGNAMAYYYTQASNAYGENGNTTGGAVSYIRDDYLQRIDYGFRDGGAYGTVADQVVFTPGDRCVAGASSCDPLSSSTAASWPDVPYDMNCAAGAACAVTSPSIWSTVSLASITTQQWNGSTYAAVDSYKFTQTIPSVTDGTAPTLWLSSITRTGADTSAGGSAVTLNPVTFTPVMMANRADLQDGLPALDRYRIAQITTETGSVIGVSYELTNPCSSPVTVTPSSNATSCYPVYWTPSGGTQTLDWFNKYAVASVSQSDPTGGSAGLYTGYKYADTPAWHYDDNELVQPKYRTYGQFRGYGDVQTFTGQGSDPLTESEAWYYRGMSADNGSGAVTLTDSQGATHDDTNGLAGQTLESAQYFYKGGPVASSTIQDYWISPVTATRTRAGLPDLTAQMVEQAESWTRSAVTDASPSTWRETANVTTYDANTSDATFGLPLYTYDTGDLTLVGTANSQETCTETTYTAPNTSLNLVALVAETRTLDKACGGSSAIGSSNPTAPTGSQVNALAAPSSVNLANDVVEDTRTFYDDSSLAGTWPQPATPTWPQSAPSTPQVSVNQAANGYDTTSGQLTYLTKSASVYDNYNRPSTEYDAVGDKTTYAYTMTSYGTVTAASTTNPLGQIQSAVMDPARSLVTAATDANNLTTTVHYDGLGRTTAVWYYGRATSTPANNLYTYAVSNTAATAVTTETLNEESGDSTSVQIYDALLRPRQTQTQAVSNVAGRIITDTIYDTHGWVVKTNTNYYDKTSNPDATLESTADNQVAQQTLTSYDGLGRAVEVQSKDNTATPVVDNISYAEYTGDKTITVPPTGGVAQASVTDALGRATELDQYTTAPTVTTAVQGGFTTVAVTGGNTQATTYGYNTHGLASTTTDANGDTWSTGYDFLGEATSSTDPDAGKSTTAYDAQGRVVQSADAMGNTLSYTYDKLGRKTAEFNAPTTNQQLYTSASTPGNETASWIYDNSNTISGVTDAIGHMTTQNSYTSAGVFTTQELGYNNFGESLGESYTVPGTSSMAGTYTYKHTYTPITGLPKQNLIPAAGGTGGMAQEITTAGYSVYEGLDMPTALNGLNGYAHSVTYSVWGQIAEVELGTTTNNAYVDNTYDEHTGALTNSKITNTAVSQQTPIDQESYTYDASGNPTSQTETRSGTTTETQCFGYDALDRLTNAWTASSGCGTTPTTANETTTVGDQISGSAYWTSWSFDNIGQATSQTQHSPTGGTDTVTNYAYGANNTSNCAGDTGGGANTLNATSTTGPAGTTSATYCSNADGQTTSMPAASSGQNSLAWNPQGQLATVATASGNTGYTYDATGNLVERTDPGTITVYLPDQQMVYNTSSQAVTTTRSIALPGGAQVIETSTTGNYRFEVANTQGTAGISLDSTLKNPTYQQYTPYGAKRGSTPAPWTDPNSFLGKVQDTADNLVTMGARQYDPDLGRFISVDPLLETSSPQQLNGYTYAADNPVTGSDPTGEACAEAMSSNSGGLCGGGGTTTKGGSGTITTPTSPTTTPTTPTTTATSCAGMHGKLAWLCNATGSGQPVCSGTCLQIQQESLACGSKGGVFANGTCTITPPAKPHHWWETALQVVAVVVVVAVVIALATQPELLLPALEAASMGSLTAAGGGATLGLSAAAGAFSAGAAVATAVGADTVAVGLTLGVAAAGGAYEASGAGPENGCGESFTSTTAVLTSSGKKVPISSLTHGTKIEATNTATGKKETQTVDDVMVKHDTDLYDLRIGTQHGPSVIHTTSNHLFWDETNHGWITAGKLHPGDHLRTADGSTATVLGGTTPESATGWMWDLTISNDHDFYVVAGSTPVLVHNCTTSSNAQILDANMQTDGIVRPADTAAHHIVASTSPKAAPARAQLDSFGIDINDSDNGVYLPRGSASSNPQGMAVHSRVHTNLYYDNVNEMMSWAQNADQARDVLGYIRNQLQSGPWP